MNEKTDSVNEALEQSKENAIRIGALESSVQSLREVSGQILDKLSALDGRLSNEMRTVERNHQPNFGIMASWAGVVLVLVSLVGGGMFYYINKRFDAGDTNRLENFNQLDRRITRLEDNEDREREADLERLKDWQMEQLSKKGT